MSVGDGLAVAACAIAVAQICCGVIAYKLQLAKLKHDKETLR